VNIYAIRDRLLNYFIQPFVAPEDKPVLASVARLINTGDLTSDIAQAPHQFEVWKLGKIEENGKLVDEPTLLATCETLIRPRPGRPAAGPGEGQVAEAPSGRPEPPIHIGGSQGTD